MDDQTIKNILTLLVGIDRFTDNIKLYMKTIEETELSPENKLLMNCIRTEMKSCANNYIEVMRLLDERHLRV